MSDEDSLIIDSGGDRQAIAIPSIVYVEHHGRKSTIHLADGRTIDAYMKPDEFAGLLGGGFVRVHSGYLVNAARMRAIVMDDGSRLPVGRTWRDTLAAGGSSETHDDAAPQPPDTEDPA